MAFSKALFINLKEEDIPSEYLKRIKEVIASCEFVSQENPKLIEFLFEAEVIFGTFSTKIDKKIIDASPNLKYIGVLATAFDGVDAQYARQKGVTVCNLGGYSTKAVAEFFFAVIFDAIRELERAKQQARSEDYSFGKFLGLELNGKTLGVMGAGKIGSRTAKIGLGIGMKVIYFDKENKPELDMLGAERKEIDEVLSQSDFISLNLILNHETEGMVNRDKIGLLKAGCIFVNLAPPNLIDQKAMIEKAGRGGTTFIFDHSDDIEASLAKEFLNTPNCIVYPPIAFRTKEANVAKWEIFTSNLEKFVRGTPQNVVN